MEKTSADPTSPGQVSKAKATARNYLILTVIVALVLVAIYFGYRPSTDEDGIVAEPPTEISVGQAAPTFSAPDITGETYTLASANDKPTWLVFNATWCSACRAEIPEVKALAQRDDVNVVAVYLNEDSDTVATFASKLGLEYRQVADPTGRISAAFDVFSLPSHVLVDSDGKVSFTKTGPLNPADIDRALNTQK